MQFDLGESWDGKRKEGTRMDKEEKGRESERKRI